MNVSYISALIIIILLLFMLMIWFMFRELRKVLINYLQETIITVGEDTGARLDNVQIVIKARIKALQSDIAALADAVNSISLQTPNQPQSQIQPEVIENMFSIVHELQKETDSFLKDFAAKLDKSSKINNKTLALFDDEIKKFTGAVAESINNLQKAGSYVTASVSEIQKTCDQNNKTLVAMAESFQGVLQKNGHDIREAIAKTDKDLKTLMDEAMKKIKEDYDKVLTQIFKDMADNLASIKEALNDDYFKPSA